MNLIELNRALRQMRLGGIAAVLEMRLHQAQVESMAPIDLISCLVSDELTRRGDRLLERRRKQAQFRDPQKTLDNFDFTFNPKMNRSLVFDLATSAFIARHEDSCCLSAHPAAAKAIWHKPLARPPSNKAIVCSTARPIPCSRNSPKPRSRVRANSTSSLCSLYPC